MACLYVGVENGCGKRCCRVRSAAQPMDLIARARGFRAACTAKGPQAGAAAPMGS